MGEIFFATLARDLGAGMAPHPAYAEALRNAVIYNVIVFSVLAALVWRLPAPPAGPPVSRPG
jgi:hypothetical protein